MGMTIEEAIRRIEDVVKRNEEMAERDIIYRGIDPWKRSTEEHRQFAEWLKELKSLKEKDEPRAVHYEGDGYADGAMVYDMALCPNCEHIFEEDSENWECDFCPNCGQRLRWEE